MKKGNLIVISGFSGVGKGTVVKRLVSDFGYKLSISATTRKPREGEVDGREYYFRTKDEFKESIDNNGLIEWAQYVDNFYGTPRRFVEEEMEKGNDVILEIEIQGAMNIKKQYPDAILIFITATDAKALRDRLAGRGTETEEVINKRMQRAAEESDYMEHYEYIIVNDILDDCVNDVHAVIRSAKYEKSRNLQYIEEIKNELKSL